MAQAPDRALVEAWIAMAEHFLDTETRQALPLTALRCLEAGLDAERARVIWRCEVEPAVGFNLRAVAGEWSGWDEAWLVSRIAEVRVSWSMRWWQRWGWSSNDGTCVSMERFIITLRRLPESDRATAADTLCQLARHYFAFAPTPLGDLRSVALRDDFLEAIAPATLASERVSARARLDAALAAIAPPNR